MAITTEQATEIRRLAGLMAVARVRLFAVRRGVAGPAETHVNSERRVTESTHALELYLAKLTELK